MIPPNKYHRRAHLYAYPSVALGFSQGTPYKPRSVSNNRCSCRRSCPNDDPTFDILLSIRPRNNAAGPKLHAAARMLPCVFRLKAYSNPMLLHAKESRFRVPRVSYKHELNAGHFHDLTSHSSLLGRLSLLSASDLVA